MVMAMVMAFTGFSTDRLIGLPPEFFSQVLPAIVLPSELKVTLHIFYRLSKQRGTPRRISWDDLVGDTVLLQSLRGLSKLRPPEELLEEGLDAALQRTTLLHLAVPGDGRLMNWYLVHTAANRAWLERAGQGNTSLPPNDPVPEQRPPLLSLYEQNIGLVTPLLVDELREAEARYPYEWIEEAIREAVRANARSWRYVRKVLERWATNGRANAPHQPERPIDIERYVNGPYRHLYRRGGKQHDTE
jgi:DnaD/phage-associated family protein